MWYYTQHSLIIRDKDNQEPDYQSEEYKELLSKHEKQLVDTTEACFDDTTKWYDREEQMLEYSKKYPELLFVIYWDWEESDDDWIEYYLDWKVQHEDAEVTYWEFNINKLK